MCGLAGHIGRRAVPALGDSVLDALRHRELEGIGRTLARWRGESPGHGAAGFIGANLCRELTARPDVEWVIGLDDLSSGDPANLSRTKTDLVVGSVVDQRTGARPGRRSRCCRPPGRPCIRPAIAA